MKEPKETGFDHLSENTYGTISSSERKWINKIHKLKEKYPDEVEIRHINYDGSIVARIPHSWFKITPPRKTNISEEEKIKRSERMAHIHKRRHQQLNN